MTVLCKLILSELTDGSAAVCTVELHLEAAVSLEGDGSLISDCVEDLFDLSRRDMTVLVCELGSLVAERLLYFLGALCSGLVTDRKEQGFCLAVPVRDLTFLERVFFIDRHIKDELLVNGQGCCIGSGDIDIRSEGSKLAQNEYRAGSCCDCALEK